MTLSSCTNFTYGGDPGNNDRDAVRYYAGDTVQGSALLDDKEIDFSLANNPDPKRAAAECLDTLAARFAREGSVKVGDISKDLKDVSAKLSAQASNLRADASRLALPFFGGLSVSGKESLGSMSDDVQPSFTVGAWDSAEVLQPPDGDNNGS